MLRLSGLLLTFCSVFSFSAQLILNWKPEGEFGGFYEAERAGFYKQEKLALKIVPGGVGTPAIQMVASGTAEFGISAADEVVMSRARGTDVIGIFAVYQVNPQGILIHASRKANTIADVLRGGTLAFQKGLPAFGYLEQKYGKAKAKVVPYIGNVSQMAKDKEMAIQCYITSEPISARAAGMDTRSFLISDAGYNPYSSMVIVKRAFWEKNRAEVEAFLRATAKGWASYLKDPGPANRIMAKLNPSMSFETLQESAKIQAPLIETAEVKRLGLGAMTAERWSVLAKQLAQLKLIEQPLKPLDYFVWSSKK